MADNEAGLFEWVCFLINSFQFISIHFNSFDTDVEILTGRLAARYTWLQQVGEHNDSGEESS